MVAYKDEERGTWYVSFYYEDWTGAKKRKVKRGFRTKKEALNFEAERRKDCGSATHGTIRRYHNLRNIMGKQQSGLRISA